MPRLKAGPSFSPGDRVRLRDSPDYDRSGPPVGTTGTVCDESSVPIVAWDDWQRYDAKRDEPSHTTIVYEHELEIIL